MDHRSHRWRLRTALLIAVLMLNMTAILTTYFSLTSSRAQHQARIAAQTQSLASLADQSIAKSAAAFDLVLKTVQYQLERSLRETGHIDPTQFNPFLAHQESSLQHAAGIRVAEASGRVILGHDVTPDSRATWGDRDFFALQRENPAIGMTVTDPILGRVSKIWVVSFARRYNHPDGRFAGVISVAIPVSYFAQLLSRFDTGQDGVAMMLDSRSRVMARVPDTTDVQQQTLEHSAGLDQAIASGRTEVVYRATGATDGLERSLTYRRMSAVPFHLVMGVATSADMAHWRDEASNTLLGLAAFLVTTSGFTWLLWRSIRRLKYEMQRNRTLLNNASDGIHILDRQGKLIEASDAFCTMLGKTRAELLGAHVSSWDAQYSKEEINAFFVEHFGATERMEFQTLHRHQDGHLIPVEISGLRLDISGQPVMFYSSRDITEKLRAQHALAESESRFRTLFESSPDPLLIIQDERFVACNQAAIAMLGYDDKNEVLGKRPADISPPVQKNGEDSQAKAQCMINTTRTNSPNRFHWVHTRKDGPEFTAEVTLSRINLHGSDVMYCQWRDITEAQSAAAELERYRTSLESVVTDRTRELAKQRNHFELILDNIPGAVAYWDKDLINRFSNARYRQWLGARLKDIQDHHIDDVLDPEFLARVRPNALAALDGRPLNLIIQVPQPDGQIRHAEASYVPDRVKGKVVGFFVVAFDITELKQAKDAAESASRAKSVLLANMSHELRTPMNGVLGMIGIARKRMSDPDGVEKLDKARRAAERLLNVLNDILDLSKIEADRLSLEHISFTPDTLLTQIKELLGHAAAENRSALQVECDESTRTLALLGDPLRLGQVITNLVGNAIKFGEGQPIDVRVTTTATAADSIDLNVEVEDHGIGIALEDQTRLFSAFEQADGSTTRKYGGTGLGLAICKRLIDLMGGRIGVRSAPGQGSTFWFTVTLARDISALEIKADGSAPELAPEARIRREHVGARILVAEDEPFNQEIAHTLLDEVGLAATVANDGEQALALARAEHYDLILMDMQMPLLNGLEATRAIRADSQCMDTPIVAMTANAFDSDRQTCLTAGMNDHLAKPIDPDAFFRTILTWLNHPAPVAQTR